MRCFQARRMLLRYQRGGLEEPRAERLGEHLARCLHCRARLAELDRLGCLLAETPAALPVLEPNPMLWDRLEEKIGSQAPAPAKIPWWQNTGSLRIASLTACAATLVVMGVIGMGRFAGRHGAPLGDVEQAKVAVREKARVIEPGPAISEPAPETAPGLPLSRPNRRAGVIPPRPLSEPKPVEGPVAKGIPLGHDSGTPAMKKSPAEPAASLGRAERRTIVRRKALGSGIERPKEGLAKPLFSIWDGTPSAPASSPAPTATAAVGGNRPSRSGPETVGRLERATAAPNAVAKAVSKSEDASTIVPRHPVTGDPRTIGNMAYGDMSPYYQNTQVPGGAPRAPGSGLKQEGPAHYRKYLKDSEQEPSLAEGAPNLYGRVSEHSDRLVTSAPAPTVRLTARAEQARVAGNAPIKLALELRNEGKNAMVALQQWRVSIRQAGQKEQFSWYFDSPVETRAGAAAAGYSLTRGKAASLSVVSPGGSLEEIIDLRAVKGFSWKPGTYAVQVEARDGQGRAMLSNTVNLTIEK